MLPALRECAPTFRPYRPLLTAGADEAEAHPSHQVTPEYVRVLTDAEADDLDLVEHRLILSLKPPRW